MIKATGTPMSKLYDTLHLGAYLQTVKQSRDRQYSSSTSHPHERVGMNFHQVAQLALSSRSTYCYGIHASSRNKEGTKGAECAALLYYYYNGTTDFKVHVH